MKMQWTAVFLIAVVALIMGLMLFFFQTKDRSFQIVSDDGALTLEISSDSLPSNMSKEDISIRAVIEVDFGEGIHVYRFEPSGVSFISPARLTTSITSDAVGQFAVPAIVPLDERGKLGDPAGGFEMDVSEDLSSARVSVEIPHFSDWAVVRDSHFHLSVDLEETQFLVKSAVDVPAQVFLLETEQTPPDPARLDLQEFYLSLYVYEVEGKTRVAGGADVLSPVGEILNKPPKTRLSGFREPVPFDLSDYACQKNGKAELAWDVSFRFSPVSGPNHPRFGKISLPIPIACVDEIDHSDRCNNNDVRDLPTEDCDGTDFGSFSCQDAGFDFGDLVCTNSCKVDTSECTNVPPTCGDYEGGFLKTSEACLADCQNVPPGSPVCHCLPVDDAPGCYITCLGPACL